MKESIKFSEEALQKEAMKKERKRLIHCYCNMNSNQNVEGLQTLQKELEAFLANEYDREVQNTLHTVRALIHFNLTDDIDASYELLRPMLVDLDYGLAVKLDSANPFIKSDWDNFYHAIMLIDSIMICKEFAKATMMIKHLETELKIYTDKRDFDSLMQGLHSGAVMSMLYSKYFEENLSVEEKQLLDAEFKRHSKIALKLCTDNNWKIAYILNVIRDGIFNRNAEIVTSNMKQLKELGKDSIYRAMELEIKKYNLI